MIQRRDNWEKYSEPQKIGEHPDYGHNLWNAKVFMKNVSNELLPGMGVSLAEENRVLMITFSPPLDAPMGRWAAPINLHRPRDVVNKETEYYFNAYMRMVKNLYPAIAKEASEMPQESITRYEATSDMF